MLGIKELKINGNFFKIKECPNKHLSTNNIFSVVKSKHQCHGKEHLIAEPLLKQSSRRENGIGF